MRKNLTAYSLADPFCRTRGHRPCCPCPVCGSTASGIRASPRSCPRSPTKREISKFLQLFFPDFRSSKIHPRFKYAELQRSLISKEDSDGSFYANNKNLLHSRLVSEYGSCEMSSFGRKSGYCYCSY